VSDLARFKASVAARSRITYDYARVFPRAGLRTGLAYRIVDSAKEGLKKMKTRQPSTRRSALPP
jgi:hypothetical protein